ncbi:UDP-glucose 4-epimerase GalE [Aeromicrobium sp. Root495]|uniref:UDP-glucose 4-epimerase GalE n=1 Tax=Aeromicrobium sp. Root495 TaxID=1736550 RepID=UPI000AC5ACEC|nr:UDP-glucose 4-epimerase GalE [Aeromicrobium sp. Root495]
MRVLVTGGAGYIGSHTVVSLLASGHEVEVVDSFVNSKPTAIARIEEITGATVPLHHVDLRDRAALGRLFGERTFDAVIHFAALKAVGESVAQPLRYYENNLGSTYTLLDAMAEHGVRTIVFSSSATVYGAEAPVPYTEDFDRLDSSSPYGQTKVMVERILTDVAVADPTWRIALLRYFNPVGAHPSGLIGEDPQGIPNNLVPFIAQVAVGRREKLSIFGGDYPTKDGTCERDFIHVDDVAEGHVAALQAITAGDPLVRAWNLGSGEGTSVLEMLHAFERAVGHELPHEIVERRSGDLPAFWADPTRAAEELGWRTSRTIDDMCVDTWRWQSGNPEGFPD